MRYHAIAFFSGAAVLVIEIIGARLLAPYLGTAYFVWVNIIGVILAALAAGYWLGGVVADRSRMLLAPIFFFAACFVALIPFERALLPAIGSRMGLAAGSLVASLLLFAPASVLLGMASPYLVKLATSDLARLGRSSGSIFAASTAGSIVAAFATGFLLIPALTMPEIIWGVTILLLLLAALALPPNLSLRRLSKKDAGTLAIVLALPFAFLALPRAKTTRPPYRTVFEKDSRYYHIRVADGLRRDGKRERLLLLDGSPQSGVILENRSGSGAAAAKPDPAGLAFDYISLSAKLIDALKPGSLRMLSIGGGGYSIPEYVKLRDPSSDVAVVEIDPAVTETARKFFIRRETGPIETVFADGRTFLNGNRRKFDLIYTDAYTGAFSVPWHLATREALQNMRESLNDGGILLVNIASAAEGPYSSFFRAFWKGMVSTFEETAVFATRRDQPSTPQNIIIIAAETKKPSLEETLRPFEAFRYRGRVATDDVPLLTDEYAPTDALIEKLVAATHRSLLRYGE